MRGKSLPDRGDGLGTCPRAVRVGRAQSTTVCMHRVGSRCQDQAQEWGEAVKSQHSPGAEGCSRKAGQTTVKEPCKVCREHRYEKEL